MKKFGFSAALTVLLGSAGVVYGGERLTSEVVILRDAGGNVTQASGNLADAYNSADSNQYIGCGGSWGAVWCQAHDATADAAGVTNSAFCSTVDPSPQLLAQIQSIAWDSTVRFSIEPATGACTTVSVSHNSFYRPKAP